MTIEEIYQFFAAQPPIYLSSEQAACYVLSVLLIEESYGTRLIQKLESDYPPYRLSDTVLYAALNFLETERALVARTQKLVGRGRPRRMYQVSQEWLEEAQKLAALWTNSVARKPQVSVWQ